MAKHINIHYRIYHHRQLFHGGFLNQLAIDGYRHHRNAHTHWNQAVSAAEKVVGYPTSFMNLRFWLSDEMSNIAVNMRKLIGTKHPLMKTAKGLLFDNNGNVQTRGLVVLLVSKAAGYPETPRQFPHHFLDKTYSALNAPSAAEIPNGILPTQRSLAEITEMIHTAFVLHKGVMDIDLTDKNKPYDSETDDLLYGNKMALLSGDYLLAKASSGLSCLGNTYVVETMASAISDLMESGFFFDDLDVDSDRLDVDTWEKWAYKNGACLYAKSCQSTLMLSQHTQTTSDLAFEFGKYFGLLRQMKTDNEDFKSSCQISKTNISLHSIISESERSTLKTEYVGKAKECLAILPNIEAAEALANIVSALADNIV